MAFRISKTTRTGIDANLAALDTAKGEVEAAMAAFNETMEQAWGAVQSAVEGYNSARASLIETLDGVADEMQSEYDDKSEKWQEGDRASSISDWIESLRLDSEIDELDVSRPDDVEADPTGSDALTIEDEPQE